MEQKMTDEQRPELNHTCRCEKCYGYRQERDTLKARVAEMEREHAIWEKHSLCELTNANAFRAGYEAGYSDREVEKACCCEANEEALKVAVEALNYIANHTAVVESDSNGGPDKMGLIDDRNGRILKAREALTKIRGEL